MTAILEILILCFVQTISNYNTSKLVKHAAIISEVILFHIFFSQDILLLDLYKIEMAAILEFSDQKHLLMIIINVSFTMMIG